MTLYGFALFVHVVFAIVLVGGSVWAHVAFGFALRSPRVECARSLVGWLYAFVKASGPIAGVVLLAALYLAFDGGWWGRGWPVVSLVLFALGGVAATGIADPRALAIKDRLAEVPDGPVTEEVRALMVDRTLTMVMWVLAGADLAIVFLMTNKPGWTGSIVVAAVGLALGTLMGVRESRHVPAAAAPAAA